MVDIASFSPDVWYKLTTIYSEFHDYAYSRMGVMKYNELFTVIEIFRGKTTYRLCGKYHRENDKPAVIHANGEKEYYIDGILQRPPSL
jgi:hypothetical protein